MAQRGDWQGQSLGNYQLLQVLGQGHWASVYLGEHQHLHSQAAIKVLHDSLAPAEREGFLTEARTLARLRHPHIVRILDFGLQEDIPFLVMDYAPGGTVRTLHPKGTRLLLSTVVSYVKHVASALQYAHEQRLLHRDLKPENLLLGPEQQLWLADFGLAVVMQSAASQSVQQTAGTLAYMAPEQLKGLPTPASDQYALGIMVYEWLCGEPPFSGTFPELAVQHTLAPPPSLTEKVPTLPTGVEHVVLKALAKDPALRFASVQAFALALEEGSRGDASRQTLQVLASGDPAEAGRRAASIHHLPRGTVTLLFSDIEGSTSLLQQLGERYPQVLGECRRLLRAACHQWHGHEVDMQGDSLFVAFARATDALATAVDAQRALARHAWPDGVSVRVRMGVHTGEPHLSAEGYVGLDVHRAARIMSAGHGGQVLLSQTTRDLVEHDLPEGVSLRDLGARRLKDLQHPSHLFQLVIAGLPADFPPLLTPDTHPNNLPVQPTPFIGREQEVAAVKQLLRREEVRLLTLTGPGGIGKTRLALRVAAELNELFPDGLYFVNLAPIRDSGFVMPTIAQALDVKETADQPLLGLLSAFMREKRLLLVLDNFEQVVDAARQVAALLAACPKLKMVVTSRMALHVQAEHEIAVPPLALPDPKHLPDLVVLPQYEAVALFIVRAQAVKPDFQVTAVNARAIAEICVRLEGLPLAIELAAARIKLLPPQALLARLGQRLALLTSGAQDAPERQQTLRKTIAWSYNLLDAQEQRLFQRLSVFAGGCTLVAIEAVCAAFGDEAGTVLGGVASLIDKSLLQQNEQEGEGSWLVMLETIHEFGREALATSGEAEATQRAHVAYYLALAEEAEPRLTGAGKEWWLERLQREHENLRVALVWLVEHREREATLRLCGALWRFWWMRGHLSEGRIQLARALTASERVATSVRAEALHAAGALAVMQADFEQAEILCGESLVLFRALGDPRGGATSLTMLGYAAWERSDYVAARSLLEEAVTLFRKVDDRGDIQLALANLATVFLLQGEYAGARSLAEEALVLSRERGDSWNIANTLWVVALVMSFQGDLTRALALLEESLALSRQEGYKEGIAYSLLVSGQVALQQGDVAKARLLLEESLALNRELGNRRNVGQSLSGLAWVSLAQGNYTATRALLEESLALFKALGNTWFIAVCLVGFGALATAQGEWTWAARLSGAAEALDQAINGVLPPAMRASQESTRGAARTQLGEDIFTAAWTEGRAMTLEQVLDAPPRLSPTPSTSRPVETAAQEPPVRSPEPAPLVSASLTPREREVLRLLAQGLTSTQIAEQLVIGVVTVNFHVRSIYSKLGVTSRSAATRYALEHHLV